MAQAKLTRIALRLRRESAIFNNNNAVAAKGLCKDKNIPKIRDYYGSGWVGPGLTRILFVENRPKIAINQCWYFGVVYHVYSVIAKSCWLLWF